MDPFFDFQYPENLMDRAAWTRNEQRAFQKLQRLVILYKTGFHHDEGLAWLSKKITDYIYELKDTRKRPSKELPDVRDLMVECFLKFGGRKECLEEYLNYKDPGKDYQEIMVKQIKQKIAEAMLSII